MNEQPVTPEAAQRGSGSVQRPGSAFTVDDATNGLMHMADDHPCCGAFIFATVDKLKQLEDACRIALWIRDRLQERGSFGAGFEEWQDIERAITPNV